MKYRKLGKTGLTVSEIGFGAWGIGGTEGGAVAYGKTDDRESRLALQAAFDAGVTLYDTSDFYGYGHSENLIGEVFKELRNKVVIATKVGFVNGQGEQNFSPIYIRQSIENSLERLKTDYVDLYQLHSPPIDFLKKNPETIETMQALVQEGKVRTIGISVRSPDEGIVAAKDFGFKAVQVNFNLVDQRALTNGFFDFCAKNGVGIIARTPLCFGFLTGKYSSQTSFDDKDHRGKWSAEQIRQWEKGYSLFISEIARHHNQTGTQIALRFCLSYDAVSSAIPGMLLMEHVRENTLASQYGPLVPAELEEIAELYGRHTFFEKKLKSV